MSKHVAVGRVYYKILIRRLSIVHDVAAVVSGAGSWRLFALAFCKEYSLNVRPCELKKVRKFKNWIVTRGSI